MKRQLFSTAILCLTATLSMAQDELPVNPITPSIDFDSPVIVCGDVNNDGGIDINDVIAVSHHIIGKEDATFVEDAADTNDDGKIDIIDVAAIISYCTFNAVTPDD